MLIRSTDILAVTVALLMYGSACGFDLLNVFERWPAGTNYTSSCIQSDYAAVGGGSIYQNGEDEKTFTVADGGRNNRCLRTKYAAGDYGNISNNCWWVKFPYSQIVNIEFDWFFEPGFYFAKNSSGHNGGKIPGLWGGTNRNRTVNGTRKVGDWCARFMWREFDGVKARLIQYHEGGFYNIQGGDMTWEDGSKIYLEAGVWYTFRIQVKQVANSKTGYIKCRLNGKPILPVHTNVMLTDNPSCPWSIFFSTYFGGGSSWAPPRDCYSRCDNMRVWTGESIPVSTAPWPDGMTVHPQPSQKGALLPLGTTKVWDLQGRLNPGDRLSQGMYLRLQRNITEKRPIVSYFSTEDAR
jgi:hypothetical protein